MEITIERKRDRIKIYFNGILHISAEIIAVQSWKFEAEKLYYIEYIFKDGSIIADYDNVEHWIEILKQIDKII